MTVVYFKTNNGFKFTDINPSSCNLQPPEEFIWSFIEQRGLFSKHNYMLYAITGFRIFQYNYERDSMIGLLLMSELDDVIVINTFRSYNSTRYGAYGSFARGFGVTGGQSHGKSVSIGEIVFMSKGSPIISWKGITDPQGLKRLVLAVKKELYPKKELQRFLSGIRSDELPSRSMCFVCGTDNPKNASFCFKCGNVLK